MREIKFQIYWIAGNEMLYDTNNDLEFRDNENYWITDLSDAINHPESYKVRQYTGLKDSHGNEVYEGDIIEAVFELLDDELKTVMDAGVVVFKDYGFQVQTFEDHYEPLHEWAQLSEELKVIGNIYEK